MNITNGEIQNDIKQELSIQDNSIDRINLIYPVNKKYSDVVLNATSTGSGSVAVMTTDSKKQFYLTGCGLTVTKDATSDLTFSNLNITLNGLLRNVARIDMQTTTAGSFVVTREFSYPIKVDKNSAITMNGTFTVGTCSRSYFIEGFYL